VPGSGDGMAIMLLEAAALADCALDGALMLNPLRSEREAFRFLVYVAIFFAVLTAVVLIARAL
jgi:hypothetical protein